MSRVMAEMVNGTMIEITSKQYNDGGSGPKRRGYSNETRSAIHVFFYGSRDVKITSLIAQ